MFAALAPEGAEDAKSKMGLASLLKMMWADEYIDEKDARFINDRVHANIQKDGTFSVVPQMKGGVTTPAQLRKIADVAEKWEVPMVKLTGGQRIDLLGIKKEDLPGVWADLGMPSGYAYGKSFRTVKTCVGSEFCRFGVGDSTALGIKIESRFQGLESPAKIKMAVTGCPRNCAESLCKDVGVVAIDGGRWEIYIGGAAGAHIRKGDLLATVDDPDLVVTLSGRFMQYYRENAKWLERTYAFVPAGRRRLPARGDRRGQPGHRRRARRQDAGIGRRLQGPLAGGRRHRPPPASSAPPCRWRSCRRCRSARRSLSRDRRHRSRGRHRLGPIDQIPVGEGRAFGVDGQQVAVFRLRTGAVHAVSAVCPHKGGPIADGQIDGSIVLCPLHMNAFELATGCSTTGADPLASWRVEIDDAGEIVHRTSRTDTTSPGTDQATAEDVTMSSTPSTSHPNTVRSRPARYAWSGPSDRDAASTGSTTGARRTRSSGRRPGAKIAKRNLFYSVTSEHIGFSVWSLWSVIVLFLGPDYGIDPAGKFLLTALPTLAGAAAAAAVHLRGRDLRRPQLDHHQRAAAADPDRADRDLPGARGLVHDAADRGHHRRRRRRQLRLVDDEHQRLLPAAAQGLGARDQRRRRQSRCPGGAADRPADPGHRRRRCTRGCWSSSTSR